MVRVHLVALVCCAVACGKDSAPPAPTLECPTADDLIHGRALTPQGRAAYAIAAQRCASDKWNDAAIRCLRDAKDVTAEDHCYTMDLSKEQRDGFAAALAALDPPKEPPPKGVPGLALVERAGTYALHSDWLDVTLPGKPFLVETTDAYGNTALSTTVATFTDGPTSFTVVVHAVPAGVVYDAPSALVAARDDTLKGANATLVSDDAHDVGGVPGHRIVAKGGTAEPPLNLELRLAYDEAHRAQVAVWTTTRGAAIDPRAAEMFASIELGAIER